MVFILAHVIRIDLLALITFFFFIIQLTWMMPHTTFHHQRLPLLAHLFGTYGDTVFFIVRFNVRNIVVNQAPTKNDRFLTKQLYMCPYMNLASCSCGCCSDRLKASEEWQWSMPQLKCSSSISTFSVWPRSDVVTVRNDIRKAFSFSKEYVQHMSRGREHFIVFLLAQIRGCYMGK